MKDQPHDRELEGDARQVMDRARAIAVELHSPALAGSHVLLAIARTPQCLAARNLVRAGIELKQLEARLLGMIPRRKDPHPLPDRLPLDSGLKHALEFAAQLLEGTNAPDRWTSGVLLTAVLAADLSDSLASLGLHGGAIRDAEKSREAAKSALEAMQFRQGLSREAPAMAMALHRAVERGDLALANELRRALLDFDLSPTSDTTAPALVTERRSRSLRAGMLCHVQMTSRVLKGNPAGDPFVREIPVYVPRRSVPRPVVFLLIGFTGTGREYLEDHPWRQGVVLEYDQALKRGEVPPAILVMPNCFTKYGGSQYVNSSYLGNYEDHLVQELTVLVDEQFSTLAGRRGLVGKSSGGVGALHLAMRHPDVFPVAASISGDGGFEGCHAPAFWECLRVLVKFGGDPAKFVESFLAKPDLSGETHGAINTIAMAACYSPNPASPIGCDLPFDTRTGERIESVWKRWLEFDPLFACERYVENLKRLELLHIECGLRDEYNIQWGTRQLAAKLARLGVPHHHEEHDGGHRGIQERYLRVLPRVIEVLARQG